MITIFINVTHPPSSFSIGMVNLILGHMARVFKLKLDDHGSKWTVRGTWKWADCESGRSWIKQWTVRQKKRRKLDGDLNESGRSERTQSLDMSHLGHLDKLDGHFQREHQLSRDRPLSSAWTVYFRLDSISTLWKWPTWYGYSNTKNRYIYSSWWCVHKGRVFT